MRLLRFQGNQLTLTDNLTRDIPRYAILSHTWGDDGDEVTFRDLNEKSGQHKKGYQKIIFCGQQARRDGLEYFWVDTCCIDKSDNIELQTAINSMFRWYRDAERCYVNLPDVSSSASLGGQPSLAPWEASFRRSRWFTRGWTLQELIAPKRVDFYSKEGVWLGDKSSLEPLIQDITDVPVRALRNTPLSDFTVSEREAWIRGRQTKYEEDMVYSLLGIFGMSLLPNYGEGRDNAQRRLREEIQKAIKGTHINDFSITFSLSEVPDVQDFIAREQEVADMRRILNSDGSRRTVVLHGLGGIGKTQLAVAYTKRYRDEYSAVFWFNIKDETSIQQSFTQAAQRILHQYPDASRLSALDLQQNHEEVIEAVKAWFSLAENTRWLIVFDNYDTPKLADLPNDGRININRFLPTAYQGSVIVTTRSSQVDIGHRIRIKKFESINDSLRLLSTTSGRTGLQEDKNARSLVEELDGLPLALATAGAYLRRVPIGLEDYLRLYKESWARLHTSTPSLGSYRDRTLCSTWQLSYEQIQKQNPVAAHLLEWWAYFDNNDIWFELLRPSDQNDAPAWAYELADELAFNEAMGTLHDYGLVELHISIQESFRSKGYSIHACVHSWTMHVLNKDGDVGLAKLSVSCVAAQVPLQDAIESCLLQRRLLPHAIKACAAIPDGSGELDWAFHNLGLLYTDQGKLQEAEDMYMRALRGKEKTWGPEDTSTLSTVHNLGGLYADQGKLHEAEDMYMRALRGKEKAWGPDHISTLFTVNNLGNLYSDQGKLQKAEDMYLRALQGKEKVWGRDHISTLSTVHNLGNLYADQGKLQEAEDMYIRALQGCEKALGPEHTSTLNTINNLGNLYRDQGNLQKAEDIYIRALRGYEKVIDPQTITRYRPAINTLWGLGALAQDQGKPAEAIKYYQRAHDNLKALFGPSHKDVQSLHEILLALRQNIYAPQQAQKDRRRDAWKRALRIPFR